MIDKEIEDLLARFGMADKGIDLAQLIDLIKHGQKISAIQLVLHQTGAGLKESKDLVDAIIDALKQ